MPALLLFDSLPVLLGQRGILQHSICASVSSSMFFRLDATVWFWVSLFDLACLSFVARDERLEHEGTDADIVQSRRLRRALRLLYKCCDPFLTILVHFRADFTVLILHGHESRRVGGGEFNIVRSDPGLFSAVRNRASSLLGDWRLDCLNPRVSLRVARGETKHITSLRLILSILVLDVLDDEKTSTSLVARDHGLDVAQFVDVHSSGDSACDWPANIDDSALVHIQVIPRPFSFAPFAFHRMFVDGSLFEKFRIFASARISHIGERASPGLSSFVRWAPAAPSDRIDLAYLFDGR